MAPQYLENIYSQSRAISQIFVYANSNHDSVFAVIVPEKEYILKAMFQVVGQLQRFDSATDLKEYQRFLSTNKLVK